MAHQYSVAVRNAQLDTFESTLGASPKLRFYSGSKPADCAASATGTLLAELALPSDAFANAASGAKAKSGTWSGVGAAGAGTGTNIGYARLVDNAGTTCHWQGSVTVTGGGGDITVDNVNVATDQPVTVTTFTITRGNA